MSPRRLLTALLAAVTGSVLIDVPAPGQTRGEPIFVVHHQPAIPLVSLRLSLLVDDPPGLAGAGHLIQHLQYPGLQTRAQAVGGQIAIERTTDAVIYSVTGPAAELHYLAGILKSVLQPPVASVGARLTAERDLREERLAEWETASRHLRAALRARLFPEDLSAAGTTSSAARLSESPVDEIWARLYHPGRIAVLAVGDVELADVRDAFADLPSQIEMEIEGEPADTASQVPLAPAEATRGWFGAGYRIDSDSDPVALSVAARLLGDLVGSRVPGSEAVGEHWWTHHGHAIALVVAAPEDQLANASRNMRSAAENLLDALDDESVRSAADAIRHDMLFYSRTPDRMAEVLGQFVDRTGDADAAQRFYGGLATVDAEEVGAVLREMLDSDALVVEIPPQELNVSR